MRSDYVRDNLGVIQVSEEVMQKTFHLLTKF